ncbi:uncharacterized protein LOC131166464 [Malania oleifera]|uniref:uncharacterized protein LOC131166464 n=1 Tax=Malania oleifera TaxID=397392 RepID=UPI0025ADB157|nr:uncharacterized protein LOC131166464 [Malania oleifera]
MAFLIPYPDVSSISGSRRWEPPVKVLSKPNPRNVKCFSNLKTGGEVGLRIRAKIENCEVGVSDSEKNVRLYIQFSAPVKQGSSLKQREEDEEKRNYYVNTGYAIRTLREGFPELFYRELNYDIYRDDIVFKDPLNTFVGIQNYKSIFWALRFHGKIFFQALWIDIISVWQPVESVIMVRWTVHGIPRVPWEAHGRFDGTSEYKLDKNGKIFEHRVHNIAFNSPPKFQVLSVQELIQSLGCPSTPKPTYFEISSFHMMEFMPLMVQFSWIKCLSASALAFTDRCMAESSKRT